MFALNYQLEGGKMKFFRYLFVGLCLFLTPVTPHAQPGQANPPPVAPPVVREGDLAIRLESVLGVGTSGDEVEAETTLGTLGITPRNGGLLIIRLLQILSLSCKRQLGMPLTPENCQ